MSLPSSESGTNLVTSPLRPPPPRDIKDKPSRAIVASRAFYPNLSSLVRHLITWQVETPEISLGHEASIRGQRSLKGLSGFRKNLQKDLFLTKSLPPCFGLESPCRMRSRRTWRLSLRRSMAEDAFCCVVNQSSRAA